MATSLPDGILEIVKTSESLIDQVDELKKKIEITRKSFPSGKEIDEIFSKIKLETSPKNIENLLIELFNFLNPP